MEEALKILNDHGYAVQRSLSSGAYGTCFFVKKNNEKSCVVKIYTGDVEEEKKQCFHESEVYAGLHGKGLGVDWLFKCEKLELRERAFLLMDSFEGKTLKDYFFCNEKKLTVSEKLSVLIEACRVISNMHKKGYLHLDIKLSNFYTSEESGLIRPLDMGSAVKTGIKRSFDELMEETGFISTLGYSSKKLREFNGLRSKYKTRLTESGYLISEERMKRFERLGNNIGVKDDIFSLICCVLYVFSDGEGIDFKESIRRKAEEKSISVYAAEGLRELCESISLPDTEPDAEVPFETVDELIEKLEEIKDTEDEKGITAGIILKNARRFFEEHFSEIEIRSDLLTEVVKTEEGKK